MPIPTREEMYRALEERHGKELQRKFAAASVAVCGLGGLGSNIAIALARAGVGNLHIIDFDCVDISNLNRQFVYREDSDRPKAEHLREWALSVNPHIRVSAYVREIDSSSAGMVFEGCDVVLDCLDSISSRRELNRWCVSNRKILVHAGISGMQGQLTVVVPGRTPCLECLYGRVKEADRPTPSMGAAVMHFGSAEALQAIMVLTGVGDPLIGRMLTSDLSVPSYEVLDVCSDPGCPVCGSLRRRK